MAKIFFILIIPCCIGSFCEYMKEMHNKYWKDRYKNIICIHDCAHEKNMSTKLKAVRQL